jgi:hypothetical protein
MLGVVERVYPKELSNKAWQKEKSVMDKLKSKTKTGLGEDLEAAETAWNKINWDALDCTTAMKKVDQSAKYRSDKEFDVAKAVAEAELKGPVAFARKALLKASGSARDASLNKEMSKDAVKKAQEISKKLLEMETTLHEIKLDDFDAHKKRYQELFAMQMKGLKTAVDNLEAGLKEVVQNPTKQTWEDKAKQRFRSVGNTLGNFSEQFKEPWKVWVKFDGFQASNHPELKKGVTPDREKEIIIGLVKEVLPHLKELKSLIAKY